MASYEKLKHELDTKMLRASGITDEQEQQRFVGQAFKDLYTHYKQHDINHIAYVRLMNRLALYQRGKFNDYVDVLAGSAQLGILDEALQHSAIDELGAEAARKRSQAVTDITGVGPIQPEE